MKEFSRAVEEPHLPTESDELGYNCCPGYSLNTPFKHEDKERVEYAVDDDGEESASHSRAWMTGTAQYSIQPEIQMCHHIAKQNDEHVFVGVG